RDESAVGVEELNPAVLAVGHIHGALPIHRDAVGDAELARATAGFTPRQEQFALRRELVDAGVAVAVADIQLAARADRQVGRVVKWWAGLVNRAEVHTACAR